MADLTWADLTGASFIKTKMERWKTKMERWFYTRLLRWQLRAGYTSFSNKMFRPTAIQSWRAGYLASVTKDAKIILEIGSLMGYSSLVLARAGDAHVYCIDPWFSMNTFHVFLRNAQLLKLDAHIHPMRGTDREILPLLASQSFDAIYIDGDHGLESVRFDVMESLRLIRSGGIICGDDYDIPEVEEALRGATPYMHVEHGFFWFNT